MLANFQSNLPRASNHWAPLIVTWPRRNGRQKSLQKVKVFLSVLAQEKLNTEDVLQRRWPIAPCPQIGMCCAEWMVRTSPSIYPNALRRAFYRWNFLSASGSVGAFLEELMRLPFTCFLELPSRIMTVFCGLTLPWQSFGNCGWRGIKGSSKRRWSARMSCKILSSSLHPSGVLSNFFCNYDLVHILAIWESFFVVLWPIRISHLSFCISFLLSI